MCALKLTVAVRFGCQSQHSRAVSSVVDSARTWRVPSASVVRHRDDATKPADLLALTRERRLSSSTCGATKKKLRSRARERAGTLAWLRSCCRRGRTAEAQSTLTSPLRCEKRASQSRRAEMRESSAQGRLRSGCGVRVAAHDEVEYRATASGNDGWLRRTAKSAGPKPARMLRARLACPGPSRRLCVASRWSLSTSPCTNVCSKPARC